MLGAKNSSVSITKIFKELTNCPGVSGADSAKFIVGMTGDSAPTKENVAKSKRSIFNII